MSTFTFDGQPLHGFNRFASVRAPNWRQKMRQDSQFM
jgi:hypothetical protein